MGRLELLGEIMDKNKEIIKTLIESAFMGINSMLSLLDERLKKVEESTADQKELNKLMDNKFEGTVKELKSIVRDIKNVGDFNVYSEYKNGEIS